MNRPEAERLIAKLDNLEARARDVEVGMTRIRRELQDAFRIKTKDYDPSKAFVGEGAEADDLR